jgi:hypothetical protein
MSQNVLDIAKLPFVMHECGQAILVPGDIEYMQFANLIHRTKG